jgi:hypothetical protein
MRRFAMGRSGAYTRLGYLVHGELLEQRVLLHRRPGLYVATPEGLRWCGLRRLGVYSLTPSRYEHAWRVAATAAELELSLPAWRVMSERELRLEEADAGSLFGSVPVGQLPGGRAALHRPDLLLVSPAGRRIAVELELSVKSRRRLAAICRGYARARHLDAIVYLAEPAAARGVQRTVAAISAGDRINVLGAEEVDRLASAAGEVARVAG